MANIKTSSVRFAAGPAETSAYMAEPVDGGPFPGLIVLQEFWGLNDHIKDVTQRFAAEGFLALAADMYDGRVTKDPDEARRWLTALDQTVALGRLMGTVEFLRGHPRVSRGSVGVIGFCMGGGLALNLACNNANLRATAAFYGRIPPDAALSGLTAPVLYVFGEKDHHLPVADVDRLERFLKQTGKSGQVVRYPNADHAFMNDTRKEVYRPEDAADAWQRALGFLNRNLRG
jgi:carboxymethylenebutenolidase